MTILCPLPNKKQLRRELCMTGADPYEVAADALARYEELKCRVAELEDIILESRQ